MSRFVYLFAGKTNRSNSRVHIGNSSKSPDGWTAYRALCGAVIRTDGQSAKAATCPRCLAINDRQTRSDG